jgi:hypothetical protein
MPLPKEGRVSEDSFLLWLGAIRIESCFMPYSALVNEEISRRVYEVGYFAFLSHGINIDGQFTKT